jgi:beta-glucosidase
VALDVTNTGSRAGDEIVQMSLNDEVASIIYYERVLRGFERVSLTPGEKACVRFTLTPDDLKLLDRDMTWTVEPGTFQVLIGASSDTIRLRGAFEIR